MLSIGGGATLCAIRSLCLKRISRTPRILFVAEKRCYYKTPFHSFLSSSHIRNLSNMESSNNVPSKEEVLKKLSPLQYHVTQEKGTERPFTGEYNKVYDEGEYSCIVCGQYLFSSNTKYDSGCGWPAFNDVLDKGRIKLLPDTSGGRIRTEVQCSKCSAHLGHVFGDGPKPTGKRYCINSAAIHFHPASKEEK